MNKLEIAQYIVDNFLPHKKKVTFVYTKENPPTWSLVYQNGEVEKISSPSMIFINEYNYSEQKKKKVNPLEDPFQAIKKHLNRYKAEKSLGELWNWSEKSMLIIEGKIQALQTLLTTLYQ